MPGLWTGTSLNTNRLSTLIDNFVNLKAIPAVARDVGLLYAFLGKPTQEHDTPIGGLNFERLEKNSGDNVRVRLLGKVKAIQTVANYTDELNTRSVTSSADASTRIGAVAFPLTHYSDGEDVVMSEVDQFTGNEAKTESWMEEIAMQVIESYADTWATGLANSTPATPSATALGTLSAAIDDGVTTATYGIDRSDSAHTWFRSYVDSTPGPATLDRIRTCKAKIKEARGKADLIAAPTALWVKLASAVEGYTQVNYDKAWSEFGGDHVRYAGMTLIQEHRMSSTSVYVMTSAAWLVVQKTVKTFNVGQLMVNPGLKGAYYLPHSAYLGIFCRHCGQQAKLTGVTG